MDNFMDRFSRELTSQDMIRANQAADAAELESLENQLGLFREQMEKYDECLQEMRKLNLKNIESAQGVQALADRAGEKLGSTMGHVEEETVSRIKQTSELSIEGINKTVSESLAKIAEIKENADNLEEITGTMTALQTKLEELFKGMESYLHTDNVKVYRNVQAAMIEELEKQTEEIRKTQETAAKQNKVLLPFMMITLIITLANLVIIVARVFGLF